MNKNLINASVVALAVAAGATFANEGMWMPQQLPQVAADLKATGTRPR